MKNVYYHGSRDANLKVLVTEKSKDGYVYLTPDYNTAVMYGASSLRFWAWDTTNRLIIREIGPNMLEKLYKGTSCYIYSTTDIGEFEDSNNNGRPGVKAKHDVKLKKSEYIADSYEKIMELYKDGKIIIWFWEKYSAEEKKEIKYIMQKKYKPSVMKHEKEFFPEEYKKLVKICPYLKLED